MRGPPPAAEARVRRSKRFITYVMGLAGAALA
jgi:hypothetical protein